MANLISKMVQKEQRLRRRIQEQMWEQSERQRRILEKKAKTETAQKEQNDLYQLKRDRLNQKFKKIEENNKRR